MKEVIIEKYVKDLDGLYKEIQDNGTDLVESEAMVIFYFGMIYKYTNIQGINIRDEKKKALDAIAFLDPEAEKQVIIEFELESKNFVRHGHDKDKCDLIICWEHNWKEIPEHIDVLELEYLWKEAEKQKSRTKKT
jgi:hypothetical protein